MQPWYPLPEHLRSYPCKNFQEKSSFQPIYFHKKEARSQSQTIQKVSLLKHYKVGFGQIKIKREPTKAPHSSLATRLPLTSQENSCKGDFKNN